MVRAGRAAGGRPNIGSDESSMSGAAERFSRRPAFVDPATFTPHFQWKKQTRAKMGEEVVVCEGTGLCFLASGRRAKRFARRCVTGLRERTRGAGYCSSILSPKRSLQFC